ncbi:MAG: T9SS type A sorting domain-containing protein [Bacteroidota bacterium]
MRIPLLRLLFILFLFSDQINAQNKNSQKNHAAFTNLNRKTAMMNANNITTQITNYGSIAPGDGLIRHVNNFVWNTLGDFYTSGLIVGSEVIDTSGKTIHIVSDAINDIYARDFNPLDNTILYGWEPIAGFDNPAQNSIATSDNPSSWPTHWSAWKGFKGTGNVLAKKEAYYVLNDSSNSEFAYFPFPDSLRRGLGIEVEGRIFQFDDPNAEDVLFAMYTLTNTSPKPLQKTAAGFYIDVDVGGMSPENQDDLGAFKKELNLVYFWDNDGIGELGRSTHYTGCVVLESPSNSTDGVDNDNDGFIDESQSNNIDDDGDWDVAIHDVGSDGVPGTNDLGEGDGIPSQGEPNYETLDREESDQVGLTSFYSWRWTEMLLRDDENTWAKLHNGLESAIPNYSDIIALFGSGDFSLHPSEQTRYTLGLFSAWNLENTLALAMTLHDQYETRFYSDSNGNASVGIKLLTPAGEQSISGSVSITWQSSGKLTNRLIDVWYSKTYEKEWKLLAGDVVDAGSYQWNTTSFSDGAFYNLRLTAKKSGNKGYATTQSFFKVNNAGNAPPDIAFKTKFDRPMYSDTVIVRWAKGDAEGDPVTTKLYHSSDGGTTFSLIDSSSVNELHLNTRTLPNSYVSVLKLEASDGKMTSSVMTKPFKILNTYRAIRDTFVVRTTGRGTGEIIPVVIDSTKLNGHTYQVTFDSVGGALTYSVKDKTLDLVRIAEEPLNGIIAGGSYFDGMRLTIKNDPMGIDSLKSGFINNNGPNINYSVLRPLTGTYRPAPLDVRIEFNSMDTTIYGVYVTPGDTLYSIMMSRNIQTPFRIRFVDDTTSLQAIVNEAIPVSKNNRWDLGDRIIILTPPPYRVSSNNTMMEIRFSKNEVVTPNIKPGDVFIARTTKPFTPTDQFEFVASPTSLGPTDIKSEIEIPSSFQLHQNYPNPFNPSTTIRFALPSQTHISLKVYDALGREVATLLDEVRSEGIYNTEWNGRTDDGFQVASGLYFYRIVAGSFVRTKKMLLIK